MNFPFIIAALLFIGLVGAFVWLYINYRAETMTKLAKAYIESVFGTCENVSEARSIFMSHYVQMKKKRLNQILTHCIDIKIQAPSFEAKLNKIFDQVHLIGAINVQNNIKVVAYECHLGKDFILCVFPVQPTTADAIVPSSMASPDLNLSIGVEESPVFRAYLSDKSRSPFQFVGREIEVFYDASTVIKLERIEEAIKACSVEYYEKEPKEKTVILEKLHLDGPSGTWDTYEFHLDTSNLMLDDEMLSLSYVDHTVIYNGETYRIPMDKAVKTVGKILIRGGNTYILGKPGSGKTILLLAIQKYLMSQENVIPITVHYVENLDENTISALKRYLDIKSFSDRKTIIVIDDAGFLLEHQEGKKESSALSKFKNMTDGLEHKSGKFSFLVTANTSRENISKAMLRPGRAHQIVEINEIPADRADKVAQLILDRTQNEEAWRQFFFDMSSYEQYMSNNKYEDVMISHVWAYFKMIAEITDVLSPEEVSRMFIEYAEVSRIEDERAAPPPVQEQSDPEDPSEEVSEKEEPEIEAAKSGNVRRRAKSNNPKYKNAARVLMQNSSSTKK